MLVELALRRWDGTEVGYTSKATVAVAKLAVTLAVLVSRLTTPGKSTIPLQADRTRRTPS
ncbi:MAG TPA: hypothetical protein VKK81_14360 [Candidatus Binatia bacterium]|nr:hypothetical protein [Candidatus Binatia bacterium]